MTITSVGYTGAIAPNVEWANLQMVLGARYAVAAHTDALVSATSDGSRQIKIATGFLGGWGILDQITVEEAVTLPAVSSGTQYYLVCAHRDWMANATTITTISAGATLPASMPTRATSPGSLDDQPLALVSITSTGATRIVYDLRAVGGPSVFNMDPALAGLANWIAYMAFEGVTIRTGNKTWRRIVDPNTLNPTWDVSPDITRSGPSLGNVLAITHPNPGWQSVSVLECRGTRNENAMKLLLQLNCYTNATKIGFDNFGMTADTLVANVGNTAWHPPYDLMSVPIAYQSPSGSGGWAAGMARFTAGGNFTIVSGVPDTTISIKTDSSLCVWALIEWTRES